MRKKSRKNANQRVTIDISRSDLTVVVLEKFGDQHRVRGRRVTWLNEAGSLNSNEGLAELSSALSQVAADEKLQGATVNVSLSSDFCVTRVLAGENEKIRGELRSLRERSNQYLLLGVGQKAVAESTTAIDAKQTQAWMSVTNRSLLNHVVQAVSQAGLKIDLIEHDMVAICRGLGQIGSDTESPVIIVELNHNGVDLGICYKGQLLFDYRPGGGDCKTHIDKIVQRHLERIQRYCNRQFRFAKGEINRVFLCGPPDEVEAIRTRFDAAQGLQAEVLNPRDISPDWDYDESIGTDAGFFAALGGALVEHDSLLAASAGRGVPNLMDYFLSANREPFWPTLLRTTWPIAATLLLAVGVYVMATMKEQQVAKLEADLAGHESQTSTIRLMQMQTESATVQLGYLKRIKVGSMNPNWDHVVGMVGQSMPQGVWLDSLRVEQDKTVTITGPSASEDLIFDFVRYLKRVPVLDNVNLEGQTPVRLPQGPAIKFDIKCKFNDQQDLIERTADNG